MPVSSFDVTEAFSITPSAAPRLDGVTVGAIKFSAEEFEQVLLNVINSSLRFCWIPLDWKVSKIILLQKKPGQAFDLDNLRPIPLTSKMIKLIERRVFKRMTSFIQDRQVLSPAQIGFRRDVLFGTVI